MKRYHILDCIRGITLISMVIFHAVWDIVYLFDVDWDWYRSPAAYWWQQSICWTFIFLSGFCWSLGKHRLRRGFTVLICGFLISFATEIAMPDQRIRFGVLTLLGISMLLMIPVEGVYKRFLATAGRKYSNEESSSNGIVCRLHTAGFIGSLLCFLLTGNVNVGYLGFEGWKIWKLPEALYELGDVGNLLGFTEYSFYSADYFSIMPWFFLFLAGYFCYGILREKGLLTKLPDIRIPLLGTVGRHSLVVYMLHQPIIYAVLYVYFGLRRG